MKWWLLFAGGGAGTMLRYALGLWVEARTGPGFPWGTFAVNVTGCFAIGVLATLAHEHWISPAAPPALVTRVLRGFTTLSAFGVANWPLVRDRCPPLPPPNAAGGGPRRARPRGARG